MDKDAVDWGFFISAKCINMDILTSYKEFLILLIKTYQLSGSRGLTPTLTSSPFGSRVYTAPRPYYERLMMVAVRSSRKDKSKGSKAIVKEKTLKLSVVD